MSQTGIEPCVIVIFGASGDLTGRKLIPALYDLDRQGRLPEKLCVVGVSRTEMSDEAFRGKMLETFGAIEPEADPDAAAAEAFATAQAIDATLPASRHFVETAAAHVTRAHALIAARRGAGAKQQRFRLLRAAESWKYGSGMDYGDH
jgi:glucose-6-phosphate 1-dehydrogenase